MLLVNIFFCCVGLVPSISQESGLKERHTVTYFVLNGM